MIGYHIDRVVKPRKILVNLKDKRNSCGEYFTQRNGESDGLHIDTTGSYAYHRGAAVFLFLSRNNDETGRIFCDD